MQKTPRSQVPALESTKKVSIYTYGCYIHAKMSIWPFLVNFGSVSSLFEVFQICENIYCASWTHVTSLERL